MLSRVIKVFSVASSEPKMPCTISVNVETSSAIPSPGNKHRHFSSIFSISDCNWRLTQSSLIKPNILLRRTIWNPWNWRRVSRILTQNSSSIGKVVMFTIASWNPGTLLRQKPGCVLRNWIDCLTDSDMDSDCAMVKLPSRMGTRKAKKREGKQKESKGTFWRNQQSIS